MTMTGDPPRVWVVVVNWKGCSDTIECVRSLLEYGGRLLAGVVICDNESGDGSVQRINDWLDSIGICSGEYQFAEGGFERAGTRTVNIDQQSGAEIAIVNTGGNLGFAGGNNVGINYIRSRGEYDYIFFLNNDAAIGRGCIDAIVTRFEEDARLGMVGCTVVDKEPPQRVQAFGGASFQPWLARGRTIGAGVSDAQLGASFNVEGKLDYIYGAALMIKRECLEQVGSMEECYFLYYEEIDWATRARRVGFSLGYAPTAVVFHKGGASIGSSADESKRSLLSEYYLVRSALSFTRKFYPHLLLTLLPFLWLKTFKAWLRGDATRAKVRIRAIMGKPRDSKTIKAV